MNLFHPIWVASIAPYQPPNWEHWLGTDATSSSVFPLTLQATYGTVMEVFLASILALGLGSVVGLAGAIGNMPGTRFVAQSATTFSYSTPLLVVLLLLYSIRGDSSAVYPVAAGGLLWGGIAITIRTTTDIELSKAYLTAARAIGASRLRVLIHHLLPNIVPALITTWLGVITPLLQTSLIVSFLGVHGNSPKLGSIVKSGYDLFPSCWWMWLPQSAICVSLLSLASLLTQRQLKRFL